MQNTLAAHGDVSQLASIQFDGCKITSTIQFTGYAMQEMDTFDLGDIDPQSVVVTTWDQNVVELQTTNNDTKIMWQGGKLSASFDEMRKDSPRRASDAYFPLRDHAYAVRFAKAARHAVELCEGKPSAF